MIDTRSIGRRSFLKYTSAGIAGSILGSELLVDQAHALFGQSKSKVILIPGTDKREVTYKSLVSLKKEIVRSIGDKQVIIKVNAGVTYPKAKKNSTDIEQIRGILDFLKECYDKQVIIAEGVAGPATSVFISYENYGYLALEKEYNVRFIDLNDQPTVKKYIIEGIHRPQPINLISTFFDPDVYIISATRLKSHNAVLVTLSLKNIVMAAPMCHYKSKERMNEKSFMHGGRGQVIGRELSYNLFHVAEMGVKPDLAVLDGIEGIEGDGPWGGEVVEQGIALASTDFLAADRLAIELMGVDHKEIKYLQWCGDAGMGTYDLSEIEIVGPDYRDYIIKYKLNSSADKQRQWIYDNGLYDL